MKSSYVIIGIILLAIIGIGGFLILNKGSSSKQEISMFKEGTSVDSIAKRNARYVEYSKEVLESSASTRRVLFFYASWCPTCRPADAEFKSNLTKIPDDVTLIRVNYNDTDTDAEEKAQAEKYQITYQHTFVQIDEAGQTVKRWNGGALEELLANIQ